MGSTVDPTAQPTRRMALACLAAGAAMLGRTGLAATLPAPGSLASSLGAALYAHQPLLVLASTDGCPFCQIARDNYLAPLQREQRLPIVQLDLGSRAGLLDFAGQPTTHDALLRRWHVNVAPTVLFFGPGAVEVAPRLVGVSADFYGAYFDERLAAARRRLG